VARYDNAPRFSRGASSLHFAYRIPSTSDVSSVRGSIPRMVPLEDMSEESRLWWARLFSSWNVWAIEDLARVFRVTPRAGGAS
jgi:hypothetical protein